MLYFSDSFVNFISFGTQKAKKDRSRLKRIDREEEEGERTEEVTNSSQGGFENKLVKSASKSGSSVVCIQHQDLNAGENIEPGASAIGEDGNEQKSGSEDEESVGEKIDLTGGENDDFDAAGDDDEHTPVETNINEAHTAPQRSGKIR